MTNVPGWGVISSVSAPVLLIGGWTLAARLQPGGFDSVADTISALAADDAGRRWVMTGALAGVGAAHIGTALALRPAGPIGRWLLATGGVATVLVAAYPLPSNHGSSTPHSVAAGIAFVSIAVWPAASWRRRADPLSAAVPASTPVPAPAPVPASTPVLVSAPATAAWSEPVPFQPTVALAASGVLLAGLGWFFAELFTDGDRVGLSERVAAGSQALWPLAAVLLARRGTRR